MVAPYSTQCGNHLNIVIMSSNMPGSTEDPYELFGIPTLMSPAKTHNLRLHKDIQPLWYKHMQPDATNQRRTVREAADTNT